LVTHYVPPVFGFLVELIAFLEWWNL